MHGASLENCARIRDLGYRPFNRIAMYGKRFKIVSDPFITGSDVVVQVTSAENPQKRIIEASRVHSCGLEGSTWKIQPEG